MLDEINRAVQLEQIDPHSGMLAEKLAYILCGGNAAGTLNPISEQNLLDLEREVFLQLCGEPETLRLLKDILLTGNPPRYNNQRQTTARHQPKHPLLT